MWLHKKRHDKVARASLMIWFLTAGIMGGPLSSNASENPVRTQTTHSVLTSPQLSSTASESPQATPAPTPILFDDLKLLDGYAAHYQNLDLETLEAMVADLQLDPYKTAAAVRVLRERFQDKLTGSDKKRVIRLLWQRLNRTKSAFVEIEIFHTLVNLDRYRFFKPFVPELILKLDHYNEAVNILAHEALTDIIKRGHDRSREARIVFNTMRRLLFLSRKKLEKMDHPDENLKRKFDILRWSIKVLGTEELKRLPSEVINLL